MTKIAAASTAAVTAVMAGVLLLGFSPAGCSCISPIHSLAYHAGIDTITPQTDLSPKGIEPGLNKMLQGKMIVFGNYPYLAQDGCRQTSSNEIVCRVAVDESLLLKRGLKVTYRTADGVFVKANVTRAVWL